MTRRSILVPDYLHPETADLVVAFAEALALKLRNAEIKYQHGAEWRNDDWEDRCRAALMEHIAKGDPRDVAAYCAFMFHHGWSTARPDAQVDHPRYPRCTYTLRAAGKPYPRTCQECGLGPCKNPARPADGGADA